MNVCVLGAGVVGLSTAVRLLSEWPGHGHVTLIADKFNTDTTSDGAFGLWEPYATGSTPPHLIKKWSSATYEHMQALAQSPDASTAGTFKLQGYSLTHQHKTIEPWMETLIHYHRLGEKELRLYPGFSHGLSRSTYATECRDYLPYLMSRFISGGGTVQERTVSDVTELYSAYDVVVFCCGLQARNLLNDQEVYPVKGQAIRVSAPWIKHFVLDDDCDYYIIPGQHNVILGGSREEGVWDTAVCQDTKQRIFNRCCQLEPSLKHASVLWDWAGLRPGRSTVRVEAEEVWHENRRVTVVYNYGHGGSGVSLHWGCAGEAARLAMERSLHSTNSPAKL